MGPIEEAARREAARRRALFYPQQRAVELPVVPRPKACQSPVGSAVVIPAAVEPPQGRFVPPPEPEFAPPEAFDEDAYSRIAGGVMPVHVASHPEVDPAGDEIVRLAIAAGTGERTYRRSPKYIIEATAREFSLRPSDLKGPRRSHYLIIPRHLAIWRIGIARPDFSLPTIGRYMGGRDHTSILYAIRATDARLGRDPDRFFMELKEWGGCTDEEARHLMEVGTDSCRHHRAEIVEARRNSKRRTWTPPRVVAA